MKRAFEIYPYCTLALNHLANHYFFTGQHFVVEQLTETALSSSNHGLLKSHAYYNLARSYHSKVHGVLLLVSLFTFWIPFIKNNSPHLPCIYLIFSKMQGDIETAGRYYLASVKEISKPQDFVLPYIGQFLVHLFLSFTFLWCCFITSQHTCPCSSEMKMHFREIVILPLFLS